MDETGLPGREKTSKGCLENKMVRDSHLRGTEKRREHVEIQGGG